MIRRIWIYRNIISKSNFYELNFDEIMILQIQGTRPILFSHGKTKKAWWYTTRTFLFFTRCTQFCCFNPVININSENASSRKLGNRNWLSQPLVHTVMDRTRALRALVLVYNCMNSWLGKPSSGFSTSWKRSFTLHT